MLMYVEVLGMPERDDRGQYRTAVSDDEILSFFGRAGRPYQTAQSVGDEFNLERSTAYRRLQRLADEEQLQKDEVGARAVVWWLADEDGEIIAEAGTCRGDQSVVEERTPEAIIETHETLIAEHDAPEPSALSAKTGTEVGHHDADVQRHRENVARLISTDENEDEDE